MQRIMDERGYDPIEALIELAQEGRCPVTNERLEVDDMIGVHKELANYIYAKRKAIELSADAGPLPIVVYSGIEGAPGSAAEPDEEL